LLFKIFTTQFQGNKKKNQWGLRSVLFRKEIGAGTQKIGAGIKLR